MKLILFLLILALLLSAWLFPSITPMFAIALILFSLGAAIFVVLKKHRTAYLQGQITLLVFVRNMFLDIMGILFAMTVAILLARYVVEIVAKPIRGDTLRLQAGILTGLLTGIVVGTFVNHLWGYFVSIARHS